MVVCRECEPEVAVPSRSHGKPGRAGSGGQSNGDGESKRLADGEPKCCAKRLADGEHLTEPNADLGRVAVAVAVRQSVCQHDAHV